MFGWLSAEATRASRRKRSSASRSAASSRGRNFIATWRPSRTSFGPIDHAHAAAARPSMIGIVPDRCSDQGVSGIAAQPFSAAGRLWSRREGLRDVRRQYNGGMAYPEFFVAPMRQELRDLGIRELRTAEEVDAA